MEIFEKYRDHSLIAKIMAYTLFADAGTSVLGMFIKMIRYEYYGFSIWTIIYQAIPVIAGLIFLMNKHQDKIFKYGFSGALVLIRLIALIRTIASGSPSFIYILTSFLSLVFSVGFAAYYLGVIKPSGRKNFFIVMYALIGVSALFSIFNHPITSVSTFAMCSVLALYGYQETRTANTNMIYAGMVGTAYFAVYTVLGGFLSMFSVYLPSFFSNVNILLCLTMPLLVFDRVVPGEGQPFAIDFSVLTGPTQGGQQYGASNQPMQQNGFAQPMQNRYQQPVQPKPMQNNFDPMTGKPLNPQPPVQQNSFDPMTGKPLNPQPPVQQNNFDPMTGKPLNPQPPVQQNNFDPMTGKPIDPNGGQ